MTVGDEKEILTKTHLNAEAQQGHSSTLHPHKQPKPQDRPNSNHKHLFRSEDSSEFL